MVCGRYELEEMKIAKTRFSETSVQIYTIVHVVRDVHRENLNGAT
jgi:hypothetical protein